jgi:hypothetical protein
MNNNNPTQPPPDREAQIRQLLAYLEQHRAEYTLVALRQQLLDAGYPNTLVDEALRRIDGGKASDTGDRSRLFGCIWAFVNLTLMGMISYGVGAMTNDGSGVALADAALIVVELLAVAALRNSPGRERVSRILLWTVIWTVVISVAMVATGALLFGACMALLGGQL